jgi:hypothetical protein
VSEALQICRGRATAAAKRKGAIIYGVGVAVLVGVRVADGALVSVAEGKNKGDCVAVGVLVFVRLPVIVGDFDAVRVGDGMNVADGFGVTVRGGVADAARVGEFVGTLNLGV